MSQTHRAAFEREQALVDKVVEIVCSQLRCPPGFSANLSSDSANSVDKPRPPSMFREVSSSFAERETCVYLGLTADCPVRCSYTQATSSINKCLQVPCPRSLRLATAGTAECKLNTLDINRYSYLWNDNSMKGMGLRPHTRRQVYCGSVESKRSSTGTCTKKCVSLDRSSLWPKGSRSRSRRRCCPAGRSSSPPPSPPPSPPECPSSSGAVCPIDPVGCEIPPFCRKYLRGPKCILTDPEGASRRVPCCSRTNQRRGVFELVVRRLTGAPLAKRELILEWTPPRCKAPDGYPVPNSLCLPPVCLPASKCKMIVCPVVCTPSGPCPPRAPTVCAPGPCRPCRPRPCPPPCKPAPCRPSTCCRSPKSICPPVNSVCTRCCYLKGISPCKDCNAKPCGGCGGCGSCEPCGGCGGCGSCGSCDPCGSPCGGCTSCGSCSPCPGPSKLCKRLCCVAPCPPRLPCPSNIAYAPPPRKCKPSHCTAPCSFLPWRCAPCRSSPCVRVCRRPRRRCTSQPRIKPHRDRKSPCRNRAPCCPAVRCCSVLCCMVHVQQPWPYVSATAQAPRADAAFSTTQSIQCLKD